MSGSPEKAISKSRKMDAEAWAKDRAEVSEATFVSY